MDILLAVDKKVDNIENVLLSGTFYSKVYEGPFQDTGKWCKDFERDANFKNLNIKKWYMWYTTCKKSAKKSCKNYVSVIAEVDT